MSLFNTPSTILRLIQEADSFKLSPEQDSSMPSGAGAGVGDVTGELTADAPPPAPSKAPGMPSMQVPTMTAPSQDSPTVTKTVMNSQVVLALLSQMKANVTNTEKDFQKGDIDVANAGPKLSTLLVALKNSSDLLQGFISSTSSGQTAAPEMPPLDAPDAAMPPMDTQPEPVQPTPPPANLGGV